MNSHVSQRDNKMSDDMLKVESQIEKKQQKLLQLKKSVQKCKSRLDHVFDIDEITKLENEISSKQDELKKYTLALRDAQKDGITYKIVESEMNNK